MSNLAFGSPEHLAIGRRLKRERDLMRQIVALKTEVKHLRKYARHHPGCALLYIPILNTAKRECTCGFEK